MKSLKCAPLTASVILMLGIAGRASAARRVALEPAEWNYGVRPHRYLITKVVRLRPVAGANVRIARMQVACKCLKAKILREQGTAEAPAEVEVTMDTEGLSGATKHMIFFTLSAPRKTVMRFVVTGWVRPKEGTGPAEVFYAAGEPPATRFFEWWNSVAKSKRVTDSVKFLSLNKTVNYGRLRELQRKVKLKGLPPDPVAFIDKKIVLKGEKELKLGLSGLLNLESDGRPKAKVDTVAQKQPQPRRPKEPRRTAPPARKPAPKPRPRPTPVRPKARILEVQLFYFSDCRGCREALAAMRRVKQERGREMELTILDTAHDLESIPRVFAMADLYPKAPKVLPSMIAFVGDELLLGTDDVIKRSATLVDSQLARGGEHLQVRVPKEITPVSQRAGALELLPVILAGLADGVNPCAFAAMVLLISVLATARSSENGLGSKRRTLLLGGGSFCVGVFITYYLAGLALFAGARGIERLPVAEAIVFWSVWGLALAGGILSTLDAAVYLRTGDTGRIRLKVPDGLKRRFAPIMRGRFKRFGLISGGLAGGVIIAVLEGVCTGQMYLPTIQYMARTPGLRARGAAWLLLYNALFMVPLVAILGVALAGVHFHRMSAFLSRHLGAAKIGLALVFFLLAAAMVLGRYGLFG